MHASPTHNAGINRQKVNFSVPCEPLLYAVSLPRVRTLGIQSCIGGLRRVGDTDQAPALRPSHLGIVSSRDRCQASLTNR